MDKLTTKITTHLLVSVAHSIPNIFMPNLSLFCISIYLETWGKGGTTSEHIHGSLYRRFDFMIVFYIIHFLCAALSLFLESCEVTDWWAYQNPLNISETIWEGDCFCGHCTVAHLHSGGTSRGAAREKKERWTKNPSRDFRNPEARREF